MHSIGVCFAKGAFNGFLGDLNFISIIFIEVMCVVALAS